MQKKRTEKKREQMQMVLKYIMYLIPFALGWYGTYQLGEGNLIDCAYKTVQLYLLEYSIEAEKLNLATQIARIAAPVVTAAFLVSLLHLLAESVQIWWCVKTQDAVAFHGDSANIDEIQEKLGKRAIVSEKTMAFRAKKHVLMFQEDVDMYQYMDQHGTEMMDSREEKEIFLCSEKILRGCYEDSRWIVCNVAESCARTYWEKFPIHLKKEETGKWNADEKILLIGFDNYGQRLLTQGILKNVISDQSSIEYHICGRYGCCGTDPKKDEYASYLDTHLMLHKAVHVKKVTDTGKIFDLRPRESICENEDTVYFHEASWQKVLGMGIDFDRIILCQDLDAENMEILNELKTFFVVDSCHIKYSDERILRGLWDCEKEGIETFGVSKDLYDPEVILKERLFDHAKKIHARYYAKHLCENRKQGTCQLDLDRCVNCPVLLADWNKQTNFIRYSNVAQADHMSEKVRLLLGVQATIDDPEVGKRAVEAYRKLSLEEQERLWKIEHIRWDRYHFMNNWDYAEERDKKNRKHPLLVPYEELDAYERAKDGDAYLALEEIL